MPEDEKRSYHQQRTDAPPPPAECPVHATWSPLDPDYLSEPYAIAAALRDEHGVLYAESLGCLVVTRMEDIERIFTDHETFASVNVQDPVFPLAPEAQAILLAEDFDPVAVMSNRSEPDHGRIRVYTRAGFSNKRIKTLEPYIHRRSRELIDTMLESGPPAEGESGTGTPHETVVGSPHQPQPGPAASAVRSADAEHLCPAGYAAGRSPVARGRVASHPSISDAGQRTARRPMRTGSGNRPSRMSR